MARIKVWCILVDSNNLPFGQPDGVYLGHSDDISELKTGIKDGAYKERLAHVNTTTEMEVWRCPSLTLRGIRPGEIGEIVRDLKLSLDQDSNGEELGGWIPVMSLQLQEYEPLVVRVTVQHEGAQHLFLRIMFPAEFSYVLK
jgi:hypothetical protein